MSKILQSSAYNRLGLSKLNSLFSGKHLGLSYFNTQKKVFQLILLWVFRFVIFAFFQNIFLTILNTYFSDTYNHTASSTFFKPWINLILIINYYSIAAQNGTKPCTVVYMHVQFRGFTKFSIKVAWSLQFLGYLRTAETANRAEPGKLQLQTLRHLDTRSLKKILNRLK